MPEETTEQTTTEATTTVAETTIAAPVYFGTDGSMAEGWQSTMPEGYRDEKSLSTVTDAKVLAKMFVDTKRMVGKNVIAIPTDTSEPSEWEQYHIAGGRPDTAADYMLKAPEDFPEEILAKVFPEARLAEWQERLFARGISKRAADGIMADFAKDMVTDYQARQLNKETELAALVSGLATDWGAAYDQNIHIGNIAIEEGTGGDAEFKARVVAKIQGDPDLTRFTSNLGGKFAEGKPPSYAAIPTPSDLQDKINTLMADPLYLGGSQKQRMEIADKIMLIRKQMKPEPANT